MTIRSPLYVNRRDFAPVLQIRHFAVPSLLATVLAVAGAIPLPISSAHSFPLQSITKPPSSLQGPQSSQPVAAPALPPGNPVHLAPLRFWWQPADTTLDMPKVMFGDAKPPFKPAPHFGPLSKSRNNWLNPDTTADMPQLMRPEVALPRGTVAPQFSAGEPLRKWLPADTTQDLALTLRVVFIQPPLNVAPNYAPLRYWWQPADTTQDMPQTMRPELLVPHGTVAPQFGPDNYRLRPVWDTTQDMQSPLRVVVVPQPPGNSEFIAAAQYAWDISDTTALQNVPLYLPPGVVVIPPPPGGLSPGPAGRHIPEKYKKPRKVLIGDRAYLVRSEDELDYIVSKVLSQPEPIEPLAKTKPYPKPVKVEAPTQFVPAPLNLRNVEIAEAQRNTLVLESIRRLQAQFDADDEEEVEMLLLSQ